jgi:hypothetical protein
VQPKNSAATILTNIHNRIEEIKPPINSLEEGLGEAANHQGPPILDAQGLSLDEIADKLANTLTQPVR